MKFIDLLSDKEIIIKSFIIAISIIFWVYFYVVSRVNILSVIIVDINSIIYTFFSLNFLLFLLLFPLPTVLLIIFALKEDVVNVIYYCGFGTVLATIISLIFFKISFLFVVFLLLYVITNLILIILAKKRYLVTRKPFDVINYAGAKATLIFCVVLFVVLFIAIAPQQKQNAISMQAGLVNLFVGDDLSNWIGTSVSLSHACTKQNFNQIESSPQFRKLKENNDSASISFVQYIEGYTYDLTRGDGSKTTRLLPDLTALELKEDVLETLREIPLMYYVEKYFAIIFALVIVSIVYVYFVFAFSIFSLFLFFLFLSLFYKKDFKDDNNYKKQRKEESEEKEISKEEPPKEENTQKENNKEDSEKLDDSSVEDFFSQKNGPRKTL